MIFCSCDIAMQLWEQSQKGAEEPFLFCSTAFLMLFKQLGVCSLSHTCSLLRSVWVFKEKMWDPFHVWLGAAQKTCVIFCQSSAVAGCQEKVMFLLAVAFVLVFHSGTNERKSGRNNLGCFPPSPCLAVPVKYENCFRWKGRNMFIWKAFFE